MATTLAKISIKDSSSWYTYLNLIYPVGSVYFASNNTSPATRFGGTWAAISNSKYLRLVNSYTSGGQSDNKIPTTSLPSHTHNQHAGNETWIVYAGNNDEDNEGNKVWIDGGTTGWGFYAGPTYTLGKISAYSGGGQAYYPAYQSFYCWVRTA